MINDLYRSCSTTIHSIKYRSVLAYQLSQRYIAYRQHKLGQGEIISLFVYEIEIHTNVIISYVSFSTSSIRVLIRWFLF